MEIRAYGDVSMYAITTERGDGYWIARHPELPGCMTHAETEWGAITNLNDAREEWIASCIEDGVAVPPPNNRYPVTR